MNFVLIIVIVVLLVGFVLALYFMHCHYEKQMKKEVKRAQKSEQLKSAFIDNVCHTAYERKTVVNFWFPCKMRDKHMDM